MSYKSKYTGAQVDEAVSKSISAITTSPQTLTGDEKNQALTNLGIDPVIWKYLRDPFMIPPASQYPDYTLSDEIHNMIYDEGASALRSIILNTAQVLYNGYVYKINKLIGIRNIAIITNSGEVIYEYNNTTKQFSIVS